MKKYLVCLIALLLVLSFAGCGIKQKAEEKISEALAEKMLEGTSGSDVDIDGENITITGEDGETLSFGSTEWPTSDLAKKIPAFEDGQVSSVMESGDSVWITVDSVKEADAASYFDAVKQAFTEDPYSLSSDGSVTYGAKNADGVGVMLEYSQETLTIFVTQEAE